MKKSSIILCFVTVRQSCPFILTHLSILKHNNIQCICEHMCLYTYAVTSLRNEVEDSSLSSIIYFFNFNIYGSHMK